MTIRVIFTVIQILSLTLAGAHGGLINCKLVHNMTFFLHLTVRPQVVCWGNAHIHTVRYGVQHLAEDNSLILEAFNSSI